MKTCFTCKYFTWDYGGTCGNGTCSESSRLSCDKGYFNFASYADADEKEKAILKANTCPDYTPDK